MLYIASQEAMRREDFLHGRKFESSNSPLAGVKANTKFEQRKARKGCFMKEETKVTATPAIAEQMGIMYKEVDGLYFPVWGESNIERFATVGKYGHRWMTMLMEYDRHLYNQYFLDGTLIIKAKDIEDYCWELHDSMVEKLNKSRESYTDTSDSMWMIFRIQEIEATVEEIINADLYEMIVYNKNMRLKIAHEDMAKATEQDEED